MYKEMLIDKAEELVEELDRITQSDNLYNIVNAITNLILQVESESDHVQACSVFRDVVTVLERHEQWARYRYLIVQNYSGATEKTLIEYPENFEEEKAENVDFVPKLMLPRVLADFVEEQAHFNQVTPEMLALPCVSVLSHALQGKYKVSTKHGTKPFELPLFSVTVAQPGERKSSAINLFFEPVKKWVNSQNHKLESVIEKNRIERDIVEEKIKQLKRKTITEYTESQLKELMTERNELEKNCPKRYASPLTNATTEAVIKVMNENSGRASIISSECGVLDVLSGLYNSGKSDIDALLNGYDGDEIFKVRSNGENNAKVERALLTICVMAQPLKFNKIINSDAVEGRGFFDRFMFAFPCSYGRKESDLSVHIPSEEIKRRYETMIYKLMALPVPDSDQDVPVITLDYNAQLLYSEFFDNNEDELESGVFSAKYGEFPKQYGNKHVTRMLKIAALFHCVEHEPDEPINKETIFLAINFSNWAKAQAVKVFGIELETENSRIKELVKKIHRNLNGKTFTRRDIINFARKSVCYKRYGKSCTEIISQDIDELESRKFILWQNSEECILKPKAAKRYKLNPFTESIIEDWN